MNKDLFAALVKASKLNLKVDTESRVASGFAPGSVWTFNGQHRKGAVTLRIVIDEEQAITVIEFTGFEVSYEFTMQAAVPLCVVMPAVKAAIESAQKAQLNLRRQ